MQIFLVILNKLANSFLVTQQILGQWLTKYDQKIIT